MGHGGGSRSDDEAGRAKLEDEVGGREETKRGGWRARSREEGREGWEGGEKIGEGGGDLASVRGPTGRWNPRSRLIAIKAPLRLRL